jgi:hypothetical protein
VAIIAGTAGRGAVASAHLDLLHPEVSMRKHLLDPRGLSVETFPTLTAAALAVLEPTRPAEPADTSYTQCGDSCYRSCDGACPIGPGGA